MIGTLNNNMLETFIEEDIMVQVDFVWSYALGATLAAASARQLKKDDKPFSNNYCTYTLLFLACLFAPSGMYLLWRFPHWETMQVAATHEDIPAWLVVIFAVTNITQGILGYWITWKLVKKEHLYVAHVNWIIAWTVFWFILICGWDGTGWQRFLYDPTMLNGELWAPGKHMGIDFLTSNVFLSLLVMGVFVAPPITYALVTWIREGAKMDAAIPAGSVPGGVKIAAVSSIIMFAVCPCLALLTSLLVIKIGDAFRNMLLGYLIGIPLISLMSYYLLFKRKMPVYMIAKLLFIREPNE